MKVYFWICPTCCYERGLVSQGYIILECPYCHTNVHSMKDGTWQVLDVKQTKVDITIYKSPQHKD